MDFELSREHLLARDAVKNFAAKEVKPRARAMDEAEEFDPELLERIKEVGLFGMSIPEEYGGSFTDTLTVALMVEQIAWACPSTATLIGASSGLFGGNLSKHGTKEQCERYLPKIASGEWIGCMGLTEPHAGSDALSLSTRAEKKGDRYILNGTKVFISNAPIADVALVYATVDRSAGPKGICTFIVERSFPGFESGRKFDKMGLRASPTGELVFEDCEVPEENLVGMVEGKGFKQMMIGLNSERVAWSAMAVGVAQAAFEESLAYAQEREQFGTAVYNFQMVQQMIADMACEIHAARLLAYQSAAILDSGGQARLEASYAKLFSSEMVMRVTTNAVQIFGGYGYTREFDVERHMRDAKVFAIGAGTSEVQRLIIAHLLRS